VPRVERRTNVVIADFDHLLTEFEKKHLLTVRINFSFFVATCKVHDGHRCLFVSLLLQFTNWVWPCSIQVFNYLTV
jgi:hypothetical protein